MNSIFSEKAAAPVGPYPHARKVGPFYFLSGIGPRKLGSKDIPGVQLNDKGEIVSHDIIAQTHSCLDNIKAICRDCSIDLSNIVDITVFLTHMKEDFDKFNSVYKEYFIESQPARTTIGIDSLPTPIAIEFKCVAYMEN